MIYYFILVCKFNQEFLIYIVMGFYLEFVKKSAIFRFQGSADIAGSLVSVIQECLAQRVTDIYVEIPVQDADLKSIEEILLKLHLVLQRRNLVLHLVNDVGAPTNALHQRMVQKGCVFVKRETLEVNGPLPIPQEVKQAVQEIKVKNIKQRQENTKKRAQEMLEELKKDDKEILFDLDFKKLFKEADFEIFPELTEKILTVKAHMETELRLNERLSREKDFYASRIHHLKKVTDYDPYDEKDVIALQKKESEYKAILAEIRKNKKPAMTSDDGKKKELFAERAKLVAELEALRK